MQRKFDKKNVYNVGKGKLNQEFVNLHMLNHYRRILNAKKAVDDSPPYSYKAKRLATNNPTEPRTKPNRLLESPALTDRSASTNSNKGSCWGTESYITSSQYHARCIPKEPIFSSSAKHNIIDMNLIDRITYDTKNGPGTYCDEDWIGRKAQQDDNFDVPMSSKQEKKEANSSPTAKRRLPNSGSYESAQKRKLSDQNGAENSSNSCNLQDSLCKCTKICVCDAGETVLKKISFNPKEQSLTSSRDSAYNGGVSSLPESRSPTPDERRKKDCCCCCCCEKKQRDVKFFEPSKSGPSGIESPRTFQNVSLPSTLKSKAQEQESLKKIQEDALYVKFIQDITAEVLEKNLYTNKALKKVMKKHFKNNLSSLNKDRMCKEMENLRMQLGIPEDKTMLNLEADIEEGSNDFSYPVISDSEFVMPNNTAVGNQKDVTRNMKNGDEAAESISAVFTSSTENEKNCGLASDTEDGDVISVIEVTRAIREKRKEKSVERTPVAVGPENSSEDSDRPFDSKKRTVLKNVKQKLLRTYSSSSSDSDASRKFSKKTREKAEGEVFEPEEAFLKAFGQTASDLNKKGRNVSFWKSPELKGSRTIEIRQKKTVTRGTESILRDIKKNKPKND